MRKNRWAIIWIMVAALMLLPARGLAASEDGVSLEVSGNRAAVTVTLPEAAEEGVSSLQMSFQIEGVSEEAEVTFVFADMPAKVQEYRYDAEIGVLTVYLAGTETLFGDNASLKVGELVVEGVVARAAVSVQLVKDSLQYVVGAEVVSAAISALPRVTLGSENTSGSGSSSGETQAPSSGSNTPSGETQAPSSGSNPSSGETEPPIGEPIPPQSGDSSQDPSTPTEAPAQPAHGQIENVDTGDHTPLVPLIIAGVFALVVIIAVIFVRIRISSDEKRRRRRRKD